MPVPVFTDQIPMGKHIGGWTNALSAVSIITDALVAANATITLLNAAILAAVVRPDDLPKVQLLNQALRKAVSLSYIPETHSQTTVAGLIALCTSSSTLRESYLG